MGAPVAAPDSANITARSVTFGRRPTGRLAEQSDTLEVSLSPEDLATLQEHAEFSFPAETYLDFETSVQDAIHAGDGDGDTEQEAFVTTRQRVRSVH